MAGHKQKLPKYEAAKYSFELSYTISNKWTHIFSVLVSVLFNQLLNRRVCFNVEETMSFKRATVIGKNMLPLGSIFFPLRVAPMRKDFFKGHQIEKLPKLNYVNISVS